MKQSISALIFVCLLTACSKKQPPAGLQQRTTGQCYIGVVIKKGICGQRIVEVLNPDSSLNYVPAWYDADEKKNRVNVFHVENICDFPASLREGESFKFSLSSRVDTSCITCQAYIAVPPQSNSIRIGCD